MISGFGLGLRTEHYNDFLDTPQRVDWLEILSDNYMVSGGKPLAVLDKICEKYPVVMHGVSMSIGAVNGVNKDYLKKVKTLAKRVEPMWISDHLCWTGVHGKNIHDLLPLPFTEDALKVVTQNIEQVQDVLQRPLVLENVSSYVEFKDSQMTEWEFLSALSKFTGCKLLLDLNNIYVSAHNHGFLPDSFIKGVPKDSIAQFHLAGHLDNGDHLIDTHDHPVCDGVWELYKQALNHFGFIPTMIERDDKIPDLAELISELDIAREIAESTINYNTITYISPNSKIAV